MHDIVFGGETETIGNNDTHTDRPQSLQPPHDKIDKRNISSYTIILFFVVHVEKKDEERSYHVWSDIGRVDGGSEDNPFC